MKPASAPRRPLPRLLTIRAVSEATTLPVSSIFEAVYRGELAVVRFGRNVRVDEAEVARWIESKREARP